MSGFLLRRDLRGRGLFASESEERQDEMPKTGGMMFRAMSCFISQQPHVVPAVQRVELS